MTDSVDRPGYDALWLWFELSYAGFCVLPRAFMHAMPDEWQAKMAALLEEWDSTWDWSESGIDSNIVCLKRDNKFVRTPDWLINYRHPDYEKIESMRIKCE